MKKVAISIIGSGATRDPFNPLFNRYAQQFFDIVGYQYQTSLIALMAEPIAYNEKDYEWTSNPVASGEMQFRSELNKRFLNEQYLAQPDYILIDLYAELMNGVRPVGNSYMTNRPRIFNKNKLWKKLAPKNPLNVVENTEEYKTLFLKAFECFMAYVHEYLPHTKVVINRCRFATEYYDAMSHEIESVAGKDTEYYEEMNCLWNELEEEMLALDSSVRGISYDHTYYAEPYHRFGGPSFIGYTHDYYHDFQDKLMHIVFGDMQEQKVFNQDVTNGNYVQNPLFNYGTSSWKDYARTGVFTIEDHAIHAVSKGSEKNNWHQMASDAMPIDAKGEDFVIQFDFEAIDLSDTMADDALCVVRTYNRPNAVVRKESVQHFVITKGEIMNHLERGETNHFKKTLRLEGKYARVIPYLQRNAEYKMSHFALSRQGVEADHLLPVNEENTHHL